ncbi:hypothetical protein J6590_048879 [Homalodisca vitripennis]|nr:hypothetical protein J6590_048879 [Homalodisca vitripennis]
MVFKLSGRKNTNTRSPLLPISKGVSQGSVLGPILFILLTNDLPKYLQEYGQAMVYAYDTAFLFCILASRFLTEDETGNDCEEELREAFRLYDKEGQGYITTDVLKEIFRELDHSITEDDLENMIEEIDADGSGTVDFEERRMMNTWIALAEGGRKTNDEYLDCSSSILSYLEQMRAVPVVNFLIYPPCRRHPSIGAYGYASGYLTSYSSRCDTASPGAFLNAGMGSLEILRYKESELGGRVGMFRRDRSMGKEAEGCRASIGDVSSPAEIGMYQRKGNEGFRTKCRAMEGVATIK